MRFLIALLPIVIFSGCVSFDDVFKRAQTEVIDPMEKRADSKIKKFHSEVMDDLQEQIIDPLNKDFDSKIDNLRSKSIKEIQDQVMTPFEKRLESRIRGMKQEMMDEIDERILGMLPSIEAALADKVDAILSAKTKEIIAALMKR